MPFRRKMHSYHRFCIQSLAFLVSADHGQIIHSRGIAPPTPTLNSPCSQVDRGCTGYDHPRRASSDGDERRRGLRSGGHASRDLHL